MYPTAPYDDPLHVVSVFMGTVQDRDHVVFSGYLSLFYLGQKQPEYNMMQIQEIHVGPEEKIMIGRNDTKNISTCMRASRTCQWLAGEK